MGRIGLLGEEGVGKSALKWRMILNVFVESYDPTVEDIYRKQVEVDNESCFLDLHESTGEGNFEGERFDGFLCVFALDSSDSFHRLKPAINKLCQSNNDDCRPFVLIGNKCDLTEERQVSQLEGEQLAALYHSNYLETSALRSINVDESLFTLIREIRNKHT